MNGENLEAFLARLYVDENLRERFLANPQAEAERAGLSSEESAALTQIDRVGLELAADSFARKRLYKELHARPQTFLERIKAVLRKF
ncbi:MAG: hypothetical protein K1Y36_19350 [Blastocatellia bacterium]|nr:hypothetical protein [Blastocatellia bacterium]